MSIFFTALPSSALRITGADRLDFVQGQMTGDLRRCPVPGYVTACFLNVRGQIEQFARVYRRTDDIYIHLDAGHAQQLAERLRRYIIFDQVEVQDLGDQLKTVHLWGASAPEEWNDFLLRAAQAQPDAEQGQSTPQNVAPFPLSAGEVGVKGAGNQAAWTLQLGPALVLLGAVNRTGQPGLDLHYLASQEGALMETLRGQILESDDLAERPLDDLQRARVAAGLPDPVLDGFLGYLPQEVGLDISGPLPAISYSKGCYVGQEIMARLEARGQARYGLARLSVPAGTPVGSEIRSSGKVVGQAGLEAGGQAVCRLRLDLSQDAPLDIGGQAVAHADGS